MSLQRQRALQIICREIVINCCALLPLNCTSRSSIDAPTL
jgi:hypothetical protein